MPHLLSLVSLQTCYNAESLYSLNHYLEACQNFFLQQSKIKGSPRPSPISCVGRVRGSHIVAGNVRLVTGPSRDSKLGAVMYHGLHFAVGRAASFIRHNYLCVLITPSSLHSSYYLLLGAETRQQDRSHLRLICGFRCLCLTCPLWRWRTGQYHGFPKGGPRTTDCQHSLNFFAAQFGTNSTKPINSSNCRLCYIIRILKV